MSVSTEVFIGAAEIIMGLRPMPIDADFTPDISTHVLMCVAERRWVW